jgi:hypothetical protein
MRRLTVVVMFVVAIGLIAINFGCAGTPASPRERYFDAEQTLAAAADGVKVAVDNKLITDRNQLIALRAALTEADAALAKAHERIKAGEPIDAQFYTDQAFAAAKRILAYLAAQEEATKRQSEQVTKGAR